jgi:hypothetical protein
MSAPPPKYFATPPELAASNLRKALAPIPAGQLKFWGLFDHGGDQLQILTLRCSLPELRPQPAEIIARGPAAALLPAIVAAVDVMTCARALAESTIEEERSKAHEQQKNGNTRRRPQVDLRNNRAEASKRPITADARKLRLGHGGQL